MLNSLKSKFIISFVLSEIIFFSIIVGINFNSIERASETLTNEKINATSQLLVELLKTPLIVYDLATIDDIVKNFSTVKNVIAIEVDDPNSVVLSTYIKKDTLSKDIFNKTVHSHDMLKTYKDEEYIYSFVDVEVENKTLGHIHFVFNTIDTIKAIENNKQLTYIMIIAALIIGFIISYIIGNGLDRSLRLLTSIAKDVAEDKKVIIPYNLNNTDEMGKLFYTMYIMQKLIYERTQKLNTSINDLQQFINAMNQSAIISKTDVDGLITYVNSKFCEVTGYKEDELLGKTHSMLRDPDINDDFYKSMWQTLTSKNIFHATFRNIKKNNEPFYVDATIVPLLDNQGDISEYIAIRYDVTEIVNAKDRALKAKKAKEEFLSNMSHEIRTPMNAILGFVKLLEKNITDDKNISYLKIIDSSSHLLLHIINDILDFSKIESNKLIIDMHNFNPRIELEDVVKLFSVMAEEKSINLISNVDEDIPQCLEGDLIRIKQVVFNFLSNALKFTNENKNIYIDVKYNYEESMFFISVRDEGIGISQEDQNKIFNAFEQADNSTTRKFGGSGLGLAISVKLARLMNAKIDIDSVEGRGSTFTLSLPLLQCQNQSTKQSIEIQSDEEEQSKQYDGNILVAEDNKTNQVLMKLILDDYGLRYTIANDGLEAVNAFKNSSFDIVLMDESMPNMTGSEALLKIREYEAQNNLSNTPVIALTANVLKSERDKFITIGMNDFLAKPLDTIELERVLDKFLKA